VIFAANRRLETKINNMKKITLIFSAILLLDACHNNPGSKNPDVQFTETVKDTLPDLPQFVFTVDDKQYSVAGTDIDVHYTESDSTLTIDAGEKDGDRLHITIPDVKHTPGYRGNAWRSDNTKRAGSDSLVYQPTVTFYKNEGSLASWNNFSDGYHEQEVKEDHSLYIYGLRQTGGRNFIIKGRVNTRLLKNVFESGSKDFNKDHLVSGEFVIQFEDYWLKL
jgi:hypothetical protein